MRPDASLVLAPPTLLPAHTLLSHLCHHEECIILESQGHLNRGRNEGVLGRKTEHVFFSPAQQNKALLFFSLKFCKSLHPYKVWT